MSEQVMNEEMNQDLQNEQVALDEQDDMLNRDKDGNVIPAFPVSKRTKRDQSKTSVLFSVAAILLHVLAYLPIVIVSVVLGVKCYNLMPYYSFWPFVGVILAGILGLVFMTVALVVNRKKSKGSIRTKTVKVLIAFVCLSTGFGLILTYVFPDVIAFATQSTLYCEDLYYNGEKQAEKNAALERDLIMYNLLNGNLNNYGADGKIAENGDFSYKTLVAHTEDNGKIIKYKNSFINERVKSYEKTYEKTGINGIQVEVDALKSNARKYELYEFIYNQYVLNDYDFCFYNNVTRRAVALSILDYIYTYYDYEGMLKEGFNNPRFKALFQQNYDSFNQDGYLTYDDPLLLYAQMSGRMTVPIVLRLILNQGWSYTQSSYNGAGGLTYTEDGNCLYQLYDPELVEKFKANGGKFEYTGTITDQDGNSIEVKYGFNEDGWQMYENGVTKRPLSWLVLDMLGDPMALTTLDIANLLGNQIYGIVQNVLNAFPTLIDGLGGLMQEDLIEVVKAAAGGAQLSIGLCIDDNGLIAINLFPMNAPYGMLGYMQATWVDSDNLLMAVINVVSLRNWMAIFGAIGSVLIIAAGVCRDMGEKTRKRTEDSRDRILRAKAAEENGVGVGKPDEQEPPLETA
ncbi:unknown [Firmicutes bacterium CAG:475]|nr:unknown [Firmicutes bacterium CAG:475]